VLEHAVADRPPSPGVYTSHCEHANPVLDLNVCVCVYVFECV
jgi:hypothetical protein